jgi:hypothetical protein
MKKLSFAAVVAVMAVASLQIAARLLEVSQRSFAAVIFVVSGFVAIFTFNGAAFIAVSAVFMAMCVIDGFGKNWPVAFVIIVAIGLIANATVEGKSEPEKGLLCALIVLECAAIIGALIVPSIAMIAVIMLGGSIALAAIGYIGRAS